MDVVFIPLSIQHSSKGSNTRAGSSIFSRMSASQFIYGPIFGGQFDIAEVLACADLPAININSDMINKHFLFPVALGCTQLCCHG